MGFFDVIIRDKTNHYPASVNSAGELLTASVVAGSLGRTWTLGSGTDFVRVTATSGTAVFVRQGTSSNLQVTANQATSGNLATRAFFYNDTNMAAYYGILTSVFDGNPNRCFLPIAIFDKSVGTFGRVVVASDNLTTFGEGFFGNYCVNAELASDDSKADIVRHSWWQTAISASATGALTAINISTTPMKDFTLVVQQNGTITSWDARLQGSLDNLKFWDMAQHTNVTPGDGLAVFAVDKPAKYVRLYVSGIVLGTGAGILMDWIGVR